MIYAFLYKPLNKDFPMPIMKYFEFNCLVCDRPCIKRRSQNKPDPKYCGYECYQKTSGKRLQGFKFVWDNATEKERSDHLSRYFERNVIRSEGCWDWKTKSRSEKYVRMDYAKGKPKISIHVYSWKVNFGDVPKGMYVCHKCDNTRCSNPQHLFLGTAKDNNRDCVNKDRHPKGERHGNAKLTEEIVKKIRHFLKMKIVATEIARQLKVSLHAIYHIKNGKTWKNIP